MRSVQEAQCPSRQNRPRGRWYFDERASVRMPAAKRATATGSPAKAATRSPSKSMVTRSPRASPAGKSPQVVFTPSNLTYRRGCGVLGVAVLPDEDLI